MRKADTTLTRRDLLRSAGPALLGLASLSRPAMAGAGSRLPPVRAITRGPRHHWFGYYDKLEFDPTGRFVLGMEVDFEHRSPTPDDVIRIGMVDLQDGDRWIELGESRAWCWQQGCMLQWRPGSRTESPLERSGARPFRVPHPGHRDAPTANGSRIRSTRSARTERWAVAPDYRRVSDMRPGLRLSRTGGPLPQRGGARRFGDLPRRPGERDARSC